MIPAKRVGLFGVAAILAVGIAAGGAQGSGTSPSSKTSPAQTYRIALILPDFTANELILDQKNGAVAAAKKLGVTLMITGSGSAETQVKAVQDAIGAKVDAIVYNTIDAKAMAPAIRQANDAHIPVICSNSCTTGKHAVKVTFDYTLMGKLAGKWIASQLPDGKGTLGIVDTSRADASVQQIYKGLYAGLKAAHATPSIKISPPTNWDPAKALTVSANFLTANPNLDVLICFHDLVANACRQSMNAGGYKHIPLAGLGGTCQGFSNMLKGRQDFTVAQFLYSAGDLGVVDAVDVLKGHPPKNRNQIAPMLGITTADAKAILAGTKKVPPGLGLREKIKRASEGCK
ncbi:MAG TPA: sugar ABC transporter substrate-binding protein [Gaiellaceae bacterium]